VARGDWVKVIYRTGVGTAEHLVTATSVGSMVETEMPAKNATAPFVEVREMNKAGDPVRTARFAAADVVGLIEGHNEPIKKKVAK
jgi:hypothetical protein